MNFGLAAVLVVALVIFTVTATALMFYVRHWAGRQAQKHPVENVTEGRFVKRYIPPPLRDEYDQKRGVRNRHTTVSPQSIARFMNLIIGGLVLTVIGSALVIHRYRLMEPIDLTPAEIMELRTMKASWSAIPQTGLPSMEQRLAFLRNQGVALIESLADKGGLVINGKHITAMAENHWLEFFARWGIPYRRCGWSELTVCLENRIGIVLPGNWQFEEMERVLANGSSLILYGPPASVLTSHRPLQWEGLTFEPYSNASELRYVAMRGDQLLTLGFDAGLTLEADHVFKGYRVFSDAPQAIGIDSDMTMGGVVDTRIYARQVGKGRLVWMDYAPDPLSQADSINVRYLEAVNAAVFRYLLKETYSSWAMWPYGKRFAGLISEDSEDKFHYAERVIRMVNAHGYPITWFMLSNEAQLNRSMTKRMGEVGEVACHGDSHMPFPLGNLAKQTERMARCTKVLASITGEIPRGFRPPEEKFNGDTINAVASADMSYYMADADMDRMVPVILRENGGIRELVSLPRMGADDYEMWDTLKLNGDDSMRLADEQLTWISIVGGFLPFSFHTQYMNSEDNLAVVEHYGRRFQQPDCYFGTAAQIADWWRVRTALINGLPIAEVALLKYRPVRLRVDDHGRLIQIKNQDVAISHGTNIAIQHTAPDGKEVIESHE